MDAFAVRMISFWFVSFCKSIMEKYLSDDGFINGLLSMKSVDMYKYILACLL